MKPLLSALLFLLAPLMAQTPTTLLLAPDVGTVSADLIVFRLVVNNPDGIWLDQAAQINWPYTTMEGKWMSLESDQLPVMTSKRWSFPSIIQTHAFAYLAWQGQHIAPGSYVLAMARNTQPGGETAPVVPCASPTTFSDANIAITAIGYSFNPSVNASLERPPFPNHVLSPCNMVGDFPYAIFSGSEPYVSITWAAGAHDDTCSSYAINGSGVPSGFDGACARWLLYNFTPGSLATDTVKIWVANESLSPPMLNDGMFGLMGLSLYAQVGAPIFDIDLDSLLPGLFPNGGALRMFPDVLWPLTQLSPAVWELQVNLTPGPSVVGLSMGMQGLMLNIAGTFDVTDLHAITFR